MSISRRPINPPTSLPSIAPIEPVDPNTHRVDEPQHAKEKPDSAPTVADRPAERKTPSGSARRPLYRREPWLGVLLASFMITALAAFVSPEARRIVVLVGLVVGAIGVILLMIHKPDPVEEAHWREYRRRDD
jgi:hypothetical protein